MGFDATRESSWVPEMNEGSAEGEHECASFGGSSVSGRIETCEKGYIRRPRPGRDRCQSAVKYRTECASAPGPLAASPSQASRQVNIAP